MIVVCLIFFDYVGGVFEKLLPKEDVFSQALYTFDIGQNDLTAGYFANMSTDEVRAYIPDVLDQFKNIIKVRRPPFAQIVPILFVFRKQTLMDGGGCSTFMAKVGGTSGSTTPARSVAFPT